ncbi:MAG: hypothetical protein ACREX4_08205 [Gammaproteobacteria bacterium]
MVYKRNESPLTREAGTENYAARLAPIETVRKVPPGSPLTRGQIQFLDLAGDGQLDLVELDSPVPGFYERTDAEDWDDFRTFRAIPNLAWNDPSLRFIDLTGDGHADALITGGPRLYLVSVPGRRRLWGGETDQRFERCRARPESRICRCGPDHLSGDGLTDIVRIRNGEVCYWPNLGYGRFGAKVTMDGAP